MYSLFYKVGSIFIFPSKITVYNADFMYRKLIAKVRKLVLLSHKLHTKSCAKCTVKCSKHHYP